jgi:hypothetical protein
MHFNITLPFTPRSSKYTYFQVCQSKLYQFLFDTMRATCSVHVCLGSSNHHHHSWGPVSCSSRVFALVKWFNRMSVNQPTKRDLRSLGTKIVFSKIQGSGPVSGFNSEFTCEATNLYSEQNTDRKNTCVYPGSGIQASDPCDRSGEDSTYRTSGVSNIPFPHRSKGHARYCRLLRGLSTWSH